MQAETALLEGEWTEVCGTSPPRYCRLTRTAILLYRDVHSAESVESLPLVRIIQASAVSLDGFQCLSLELPDGIRQFAVGDSVDQWIAIIRHPVSLHDFTILRELGHGHSSTVYLARDFNSNEFAIRTVRKSTIHKERQAQSIAMELRVYRQTHRWLPELHFFIETDDSFSFVMEYLSGGTLQDLIDGRERLPDRQMQLLLAEIIDAVEQLHQIGVVHRDLKPENIMFDSKGHIKLIDFEFALFIDNLRDDEPVCGTWAFLPPEVLLANQVTFANDWWAVGMIAYQATFGALPFFHDNPSRLRKLVVTSEPRFPRSPPTKVESLIRGLLVKSPLARIGSPDHEIRTHEYFDGFHWENLRSDGEDFTIIDTDRRTFESARVRSGTEWGGGVL